MNRAPLSLAALAAVLLSTLPAPAFDQGDRAAVLARAQTFATSVNQRDYADFVNALPPKLVEKIAEQTGMPLDTLKQAMQVQVNEAMASVQLDRFTLDTKAMETGDTPTGRPYARIPTETEIVQDDGSRSTSRTTTLAMKDGAQWYLVRLEGGAQIAAVRAAYPDFDKVDLGEEADAGETGPDQTGADGSQGAAPADTPAPAN